VWPQAHLPGRPRLYKASRLAPHRSVCPKP
jgi:hypothetical protein